MPKRCEVILFDLWQTASPFGTNLKLACKDINTRRDKWVCSFEKIDISVQNQHTLLVAKNLLPSNNGKCLSNVPMIHRKFTESITVFYLTSLYQNSQFQFIVLFAPVGLMFWMSRVATSTSYLLKSGSAGSSSHQIATSFLNSSLSFVSGWIFSIS
jgi:hypothetical protein